MEEEATQLPPGAHTPRFWAPDLTMPANTWKVPQPTNETLKKTQFMSRCVSPENVTLCGVAKETGGGICSLFQALPSAEGSAEEPEAMLPTVHQGASALPLPHILCLG